MTDLEKDVESALIKHIKQEGGKCVKWVSPGNSGVPDRIILLPGGRILFAELKRPKGGKLSALQKIWHKWLRALGFTVFVVWTKEEAKAVIEYIRSTNHEKEKDSDNS